MNNINYNHLLYFYTIAKEGSIVKAAKELHLTQPTLSAQLRSLEEDLGEKLFDRVGRRLELNDAGKLVFDYAGRIFRLGQELNSAIDKGISRPRREIRVAISGTVSRSYIFDYLARFIEDKSNYLILDDSGTSDSLKSIVTGDVDIAITSEPLISRKKNLWTQKLVSLPLVAVASKEMRQLARNFPNSLEQRPFILFPESNVLHSELQLYFRKQKVTPTFIAEFENLSLLRRAAEEGSAIVALPRNLAESIKKGGKISILGEFKGIRSNVWVTVRESLRNDSQIRKFMHDIRTN